MSVNRLPLAALVLGVLSGAPAAARAQTSSAAAAEALFDDGRALMKQGDHARACPKLAESQRLDPAPGTLLALGVCWEAAGRIARAHGAFVAARTRTTEAGTSTAATPGCTGMVARASR